MKPIVSLAVAMEEDVVIARQRARQIGELLGFNAQDQTRIATAVSEVARNAWEYAGGGRVEFAVEGATPPQLLVVTVKDKGPGITPLEEVLAGTYHSNSGMGIGLVGAQRLMDECDIDSRPGRGTSVRLKKALPRGAPPVDARRMAEIAAALAVSGPQSSLTEIKHQNQELLRALSELRERQEELLRVNQELEDTNRGVVALYAELDEKADHLRRADQMKSRFLSNMSHEFRTPLNAIRALSRLLLERADGELSAEQDKQVHFILKAAEDLGELVGDLLDLAKIEAGKIDVRPASFEVSNLFSALRGMLRPLLVNEAVQLVFEDAAGLPPLVTDEGKVAQILRNFLSNALKFTECGEVRVAARLSDAGDEVVFTVADTGIGIAAADQGRIFDDFVQIDNPLQHRYKGTGLGLPLTRRLARLLGGEVYVDSAPGVGSRFSVRLPRVYGPTAEDEEAAAPSRGDGQPSGTAAAAPRQRVLVVDDDEATRYFVRQALGGLAVEVYEAADGEAGLAQARALSPSLILLDLNMPKLSGGELLARLRADARTAAIPVTVITSQQLAAAERDSLAAQAGAFVDKDALTPARLRDLVLEHRGGPAS